MKTKVIILSAFMAVLAIPATMAQSLVNTPATVTLGTPLTLTLQPSSPNLNFGNLNIPTSQGTCVLSPTGVPTYNNVVGTSTPNSVSFIVTGGASKTIAITVPSGTVALTGAQTGTTINLSDFQTNLPTLTLDAITGSATFGVGATLTLNPTDKDDTYTGTFPVSVAYN